MTVNNLHAAEALSEAANKLQIDPLIQMLQKFMSVDKEGTFSIDGDVRILYSTMLSTRAGMIVGASYQLSELLTIALRYSVVRRQFRSISGVK